MNTQYETLMKNKSKIKEIAQHFHAENVRIFGSVIRGEAHEGSDIDLLVDFQPGSTLIDQIGLMEKLSNELGHKVDIVSERALNKHLRLRVLQEAVAL